MSHSVRLIAALCCCVCCCYATYRRRNTTIETYDQSFLSSAVTIKVIHSADHGHGTSTKICSANLVSSHTLVTAASCVAFDNGTVFPNLSIDFLFRGQNSRYRLKQWTVRSVIDRNSPRSRNAHSADNTMIVAVHPNYSRSAAGAFNDISLLLMPGLAGVDPALHMPLRLPKSSTGEHRYGDFCLMADLDIDGKIKGFFWIHMRSYEPCVADLNLAHGAGRDMTCGWPYGAFWNGRHRITTYTESGGLICRAANGDLYLAGVYFKPCQFINADGFHFWPGNLVFARVKSYIDWIQSKIV